MAAYGFRSGCPPPHYVCFCLEVPVNLCPQCKFPSCNSSKSHKDGFTRLLAAASIVTRLSCGYAPCNQEQNEMFCIKVLTIHKPQICISHLSVRAWSFEPRVGTESRASHGLRAILSHDDCPSLLQSQTGHAASDWTCSLGPLINHCQTIDPFIECLNIRTPCTLLV